MPPTNQNPYTLPPKPDRPHYPETNQVVQPQQPAVTPPDAAPVGPDYGFITEPPKPQRQPFKLPGLGNGSSLPVRIAVVAGSLLLLVIIFAIARSLLSGGGNTEVLTNVAQQQQSMIHILQNGAGENNQQQAVLSDTNQNFAATAKLSLTSAQQELIQYMANNGKKVKTKNLSLKIDPKVDEQLSTAASNSTYDPVFKQVMQDQLTSYEKAIQAAYKETSGPKGRALLQQEFQGAQLLLTQLNSPAS
jgi:hypothetical protein